MFRQAPSFPYHDLGIVEDGNTASRAISKDAYVIWKGASYFASTDILQGATLEEDVNLTAIPDGVINGVVSALNNNINGDPVTITAKSGFYIEYNYSRKIGNNLFLSFSVKKTSGNISADTWTTVCSVSGLTLTATRIFPVATIGSNSVGRAEVQTNGDIKIITQAASGGGAVVGLIYVDA